MFSWIEGIVYLLLHNTTIKIFLFLLYLKHLKLKKIFLFLWCPNCPNSIRFLLFFIYCKHCKLNWIFTLFLCTPNTPNSEIYSTLFNHKEYEILVYVLLVINVTWKKFSQKKFQFLPPKKFWKNVWACIGDVFLNSREVLTIDLTIGDIILFFIERNTPFSIAYSSDI